MCNFRTKSQVKNGLTRTEDCERGSYGDIRIFIHGERLVESDKLVH